MTDELHADVARLREKATEFDGFAERAGKIAGQLRDNLDTAGECWGSDEVGRSFAAAHQPAGAVLDTLGSLGSRLGEMGTRLGDAASSFHSGDEQAAAELRSSGEE